MNRLTHTLLTALMVFGLTACSPFYDDEVRPPSEQELADMRADIKPQRTALQNGIFHMQKVQTGSNVRVKDMVKLKKPDLPPFDVAYIDRNLEEVVLELANAAGESVLIPQSIRGQRVTIVHSGADFPTMLSLVLGKAGYSTNYINGVWYVTRYPVRQYVLEIGQSNRSGSLSSKSELSPEVAAGMTSGAGGSELATDYNDQLWAQVKETISELIKVGATGVTAAPSLNATGVTPDGQLIANGQTVTGLNQSSTGLLPPPEVNGQTGDTNLFSAGTPAPSLLTVQNGTSTTPDTMVAPDGTSHLGAEESSTPWYRLTESAGMLTVRASPDAHRQIEEYLEQVQSSALRQILVEARIMALIRDKTTDRGADLNLDISSITGSALNSIGFFADGRITRGSQVGGFFTLASGGDNMALVLQSLSKLGDVYTISTPTIMARNNQLSRVSVTRQLGYVETEVTQNTTSTGDITIGSRQDKARFKNSGTVMSVLPFIGKSHVQMRFRLSIASKAGDTSIKTSIGTNGEVTNLVPELSNNVIDQDMVMEYGRIYAIGGLVENNTTVQSSYEPMLRQIPGLGEVFQRANVRGLDTEFLVLMKVSRS
ncbi:MAG: hypothetical protein COY40_05775 [Alphaproteobacteria bacterium CG_4_10_14_0_8_um_filter_53_9]|nr:MAG: hypothetical protein COY40_05775 [Alphaproteobacteria bacterium CG_4_10_14_0_8_um_filter_53_9]